MLLVSAVLATSYLQYLPHRPHDDCDDQHRCRGMGHTADFAIRGRGRRERNANDEAAGREHSSIPLDISYQACDGCDVVSARFVVGQSAPKWHYK